MNRAKELGLEVHVETSYFPSDAEPAYLRLQIYRCVLDLLEKGIATNRLCLVAPADHVFGYGLESFKCHAVGH